MFIEIIKFIVYSGLIVLISKYILVTTLRKLAEALNLKPKTVGDVSGYATSVPELLTITTSSLRGLTGASVYNILSSNVINLIQYLGAILLNKNISKLFKKAVENMNSGPASIAWENAVDTFSGNLNIEDKQAIKTLSKLLRNNRC